MDKISSGNLSDIHSLYESIHHETSEAEVLNEYAGQAPVASGPSRPRFGPTQAQQAANQKTQASTSNKAQTGTIQTGTGILGMNRKDTFKRTAQGNLQITNQKGTRDTMDKTIKYGGASYNRLTGKNGNVTYVRSGGPTPARPATPAPAPATVPAGTGSGGASRGIGTRPPAAGAPGGVPGGPKVVPAGGAKPTGSAMDQWAKANPKLAAAAAEKARIRGTQQTDNPMMKDMRSNLPMNSPSVQAPAVAKLGAGNQSLSQNPNAFKAAPTSPAAPSLGQRAVASPTPGASAFKPSTVNVATQPNQGVAPITNRIAAQNSAVQNAGSTYGARAFQTQSFDYNDMYETILEYLIDEGHAESLYEAEYIMTEMEPGIMADIFEAKYGTAKGRHKLALKVSKGQDVGAAGGGFEKIVAKQSKKYGKKRATKIAAAAMWKNLAKE